MKKKNVLSNDKMNFIDICPRDVLWIIFRHHIIDHCENLNVFDCWCRGAIKWLLCQEPPFNNAYYHIIIDPLMEIHPRIASLILRHIVIYPDGCWRFKEGTFEPEPESQW